MAADRSPAYRRVDGCVDRVWQGRVLLVDPTGANRELEGGAAAVWLALAADDGASTSEASVDEVHARVARSVEPGVAPDQAQVRVALDLLVDTGLAVRS